MNPTMRRIAVPALAMGVLLALPGCYYPYGHGYHGYHGYHGRHGGRGHHGGKRQSYSSGDTEVIIKEYRRSRRPTSEGRY